MCRPQLKPCHRVHQLSLPASTQRRRARPRRLAVDSSRNGMPSHPEDVPRERSNNCCSSSTATCDQRRVDLLRSGGRTPAGGTGLSRLASRSATVADIGREVGVQQLAWIDVERPSQTLDVLNRQVAQPPLDGADIGSVQRRPIRQLFLRQASGDAYQSKVRREKILKVLRIRGVGTANCRSSHRWTRCTSVLLSSRGFR